MEFTLPDRSGGGEGEEDAVNTDLVCERVRA